MSKGATSLIKMVLGFLLGSTLCACVSSYTKRYYEPSGSGRLVSPKYSDPGPATELQIGVESLRSFGIRAVPYQGAVSVCMLMLPEPDASVEIEAFPLQRAKLPSGQPLSVIPRLIQIVFSPQEWNYPDSMPKTVTLPLQIVGARIAADGSFGSADRYRGVSICSLVETTADEFLAEIVGIVVNGRAVAPQPVRFQVKTGSFVRPPSAW